MSPRFYPKRRTKTRIERATEIEPTGEEMGEMTLNSNNKLKRLLLLNFPRVTILDFVTRMNSFRNNLCGNEISSPYHKNRSREMYGDAMNSFWNESHSVVM